MLSNQHNHTNVLNHANQVKFGMLIIKIKRPAYNHV